jgi:integrase
MAESRAATTATISTHQSYADNSESYHNFIDSIDSKWTKKIYHSALVYFLRFTECTNSDQLLQIPTQNLTGLIRDYIISLRYEKKLSPASVATYTTGLTHFFEMNDVSLNWKKLKKFKAKFRTVTEDRPYSREEIGKLIANASLRNKIMILLMASSGMRRGALCGLRLKDMQKIDSYNIFKFTAYHKETESYVTYCTPECHKYIEEYLEWRQRLGEKLLPTSPLLRQVFDTVTEVNRPVPITIDVVSRVMSNLLDRTGIRAVTSDYRKRGEMMQCHGLRKYFKTACINAGMNPLYSEYLMGHRSGLTKSYFKPTDTELLEGNDKALGYVAAINDLTIANEHRLAKRLTEKEQYIKQLETEDQKAIAELRQKMARLNKLLEND